MDSKLDLGRWQEKPRGVAYRRWVIVSTGLRQLLRMRFFQILVFLAWAIGVLIAAAGFVFTQSVATGGWFESWAADFGPRAQAVVSAFCALVLLYPDICITGLFSAVFWAQAAIGMGLSLLALSVVVPRLITRDRASNALTIYLSRPLTSADYLLGKLGIIVGILLLLWTGPLLFGWVLSMAFAPDTDFFVYSFSPLVRAGLFNVIGLVVLATVSLGVSSLGKSARAVMPLWIGLWIVAGTLANIPNTPEFVRCASFTHNLQIVRQDIFRLDEILIKAGQSLPLVNRDFSNKMIQAGEQNRTHNTTGAVAGLVVIVVISSIAFSRKLRPE